MYRINKKYLTVIAMIVFITLQMSCSSKKSSSLDTESIATVASSDVSTQSEKNGETTTNNNIMPDSTTTPSTTKTDQYSSSIDIPVTFPEIEITPPFDIMKTTFNERSDNEKTLYILIPSVDLDQRRYVTYIKNIVKKLIVYGEHSETISILIFDDEDSLDKIFQNADDPDLNIPSHYIARYDGHMKGVTYNYNLTIFPLAPKSNSYVYSHHDIIKFNPYNW